MTRNISTLKILLAALLCLCLLLGRTVSLAEDVANVTDHEGPKLYDFQFNKNHKSVKIGGKIKLSVKARDRSGISHIGVEFWNMEEDVTNTVPLIYDAASDQFSATYIIGTDWVPGDYVVNRIITHDSFGNTSQYISLDDSSILGSFTVKPKTFPSFKATVKIKEDGKTLEPLDVVHAEVKAKTVPNNTTMLSVILRDDEMEKAQNNELRIDCYYNEQTKKYEGTASFGWDNGGGPACPYPSGTYDLEEVHAWDNNRNTLGIAKVSGQSVTLLNKEDDDIEFNPPKISSGKMTEKGKTLHAGDTVHFRAKVRDDTEVTWVFANLFPLDGYNGFENYRTRVAKSSEPNALYTEMQYNEATGYFEGELQLTENTVNNTYFLWFEAYDIYENWGHREYEKQKIVFDDEDYVTDGIRDFVQATVKTITGSDATASQIEDFGLPLARGDQSAVQTVKAVLDKAGLSAEDKVKKLCLLMTGSEPSAEELASLLKLKDEDLIDTLADNKVFRNLCNNGNILVGSFGGNTDGPEYGVTPVTKIKLSQKKATLKVKKKLTLTATITPDDATITDVEWSSSDSKIAKVDKNGKVKAVSAGKCTITCKATDGSGVSAKCKITVEGSSNNSRNELKLAEPVEKVKLKVGESQRITLTNADMKVKWSSSDKSVAKVTSSGKIKAIGAGKCTITCEAEDGTKIEIPVKVK